MKIDRSKPPEARDWTTEEIAMAAHLLFSRPKGLRGVRQSDMEKLGTVLWRTPGSVNTKLSNLKSRLTGRGGFPHGGKGEEAVISAWTRRKEALAERFHALVLDYMGIPWNEVETHPWTRRLDGVNKVHGRKLPVGARQDRAFELQEKIKRSIGLRAPRQAVPRVARNASAQDVFRDAVLAAYEMRVGSAAARFCPGCGHGRTKANGLALLEAHHLVPVELDAVFDYRIGLPLCPNCHRLCTVGDLEVRQKIVQRALGIHPSVRGWLREARKDGIIGDGGWQTLLAEGILNDA